MAAKKKSAEAPASSNIWAVVGSDDLKVKEVGLELSRKLAPPDAGELGLEIIEGAADYTEEAVRVIRNTLEALQTLPFFGGGKLVWLKGATIFGDNQAGRSDSTVQAAEGLLRYLQNELPADVKFLLTATEIDKRRTFYLGLKKIAHLEIHDAVDTGKAGWEEAVMPNVEERAGELGLNFTPDALQLFVMLTGEQSRQIDNELAKLDLYLEDRRRVELEDVRGIVSKSHTGVIWELGNALGERSLPRALAIVDELMQNGESAIGILLASIVPKVRNMFQARELSERHHLRVDYAKWGAYQEFIKLLERLPPETVAALPKKKEGGINGYPLFLAAKDSERFTAAELRQALEYCLNANRRLVTSSLDPKVVLDQLLMRILARPAAPARPARRKAGA